jgi:hypothetical protein
MIRSMAYFMAACMCSVTHSANTHSLSKCGTESSARAISITLQDQYACWIYLLWHKEASWAKQTRMAGCSRPRSSRTSCTCARNRFLKLLWHSLVVAKYDRVTASRISLSCKWASFKLGLAGTNSDNFKLKNVVFSVRLSGSFDPFGISCHLSESYLFATARISEPTG